MVGGKWTEVKDTNPGQIKFDYLFKIVLIGQESVGKTAVLQRLRDDSFSESCIPTIGVDFAVKCMQTWQGEVFKLQIWDTAGQERYRSITTSYYRGAHGIMLVFDLTNRDTFINLPHWFDEIKRMTMEDVAVLLIGNKSDADSSERKVSTEEAENLAKMMGYTYFEVSAKEGTNIDNAFQEHAELMAEKKRIERKKASESHAPGPSKLRKGALNKTQRKDSDDSLARDSGHGMKLRSNSLETKSKKGCC